MELVAHVLFGQVMSRFGDLGVEFQEMMNAFGVTADGSFVVARPCSGPRTVAVGARIPATFAAPEPVESFPPQPAMMKQPQFRAAAVDICTPSATVVFEQLVQFALSSFHFVLPQPFTYAAPPTQVYDQPHMACAFRPHVLRQNPWCPSNLSQR